ncbi:neuromedin-B isoform X1 [Cavia porcellus]|uniref:neuromedin-B isoform X1 n=1 Tax=Cavia porcellus TaxID=10141 RepID=UPI002FE0196B
MTRLTRGTRLLGGFLLWALLSASVAPFSWDLPESRSRAGKIRVHPRGNLWATGHFMGKKSLEPLSPSPTGTAPHTFPRDQELQLSHDLLRSLLLRRALGLSSPAPHTQEEGAREPAVSGTGAGPGSRSPAHLPCFHAVQEAADAPATEVTPGTGGRRSVGLRPPRPPQEVAEYVPGAAPSRRKSRTRSL